MSVSLRRPPRRDGKPGFVWAPSGTATDLHVRSYFGGRYFPSHAASEGGITNDLHRGIDMPLSAGDPVYAVRAGAIVRVAHTQFGWENSAQLNPWTLVGSDAAFTQSGTSLHVAGNRVGAKTFATSTKLAAAQERVDVASDWEIRLILTSTPSIAGGVVGFGFYDARLTEYAALEYDGVSLTARGIDKNGVLSVNGTAATASPPTLRILYTQSSNTLAFQYTTDNPVTTSTTWTTVATMTTSAFTNTGWPAFTPAMYWRSTDTNATVETCDVDLVGWYSAISADGLTLGRFGNYIRTIGSDGWLISQLHCADLVCKIGDVVEAGQLIGYAGTTGFDNRSGPVGFEGVHCHVEFTNAEVFFYSNANAVNPLTSGLLPRVDVSNNVSATITTANDPSGTASWLMTITSQRGDEDFDVNEISLTGNLGTGVMNWNTRGGLSPDPSDNPFNAGIYYVPDPTFNENSTQVVLLVYFNKSVFGTSYVSSYVHDANGVVLFHDP